LLLQNGARAGEILNRIRALFYKQPPAKDWLDLNAVIRESMIFVREEAAKNQISLRTELARDLPEVRADRVQLEQVILNLVMNAIDAMRGTSGYSKEIVIRSRTEGLREVLVSVEDSGVGIGPEFAEKIFDPFFTTKPQGIGMGLSISRSIVESHHGRLWAVPGRLEGAILVFTVRIDSQEGR
jgi:signal transduction histidine kinase